MVLAACTLLICSCGNKTKKNATTEEMSPTTELNIRDSVKQVDGLGKIIEEIYEGPIPAADTPGQNYLLTLYKQKDADSGVFDLKQTFKDADNGEDKIFHTYGEWMIFDGTSDYPGNKIYQLTPYGGVNDINFLLDEEKLHMLDMDMKRIESEFNYTLIKK